MSLGTYAHGLIGYRFIASISRSFSPWGCFLCLKCVSIALGFVQHDQNISIYDLVHDLYVELVTTFMGRLHVTTLLPYISLRNFFRDLHVRLRQLSLIAKTAQ